MGKRKRIQIKNLQDESDSEIENGQIEETTEKKTKWINKQRVLVLASRGISFRDRHLLLNLRTLFPHSKPESKLKKKISMQIINEMCEMKNCNHCIYLENKKHKDLYMWMSNVPDGPSAKFLVENVHTMEELKLTGNCLKGSRPILSFDKNFESAPHYSLLKEMLIQIFGTPKDHPKSQPFIDHIFNFAVLDNRIWFRNYQIEDDGSLVEIGPRFVLNLIKIFEGSFSGAVLYSNTSYITPSFHRRKLKLQAAGRYKDRTASKAYLAVRRPKESYKLDPLNEIFQTIPPEQAKGIQKDTFYRSKV